MASNANTVLSREFVKTIGSWLKDQCSSGAAVTRPELAKQIRKAYGRKLHYTDLNMWLSSSINLGFFNSDDCQFITKRGVGGGIVMVGAAEAAAEAEQEAPKVRRSRKAPEAQVAATA